MNDYGLHFLSANLHSLDSIIIYNRYFAIDNHYESRFNLWKYLQYPQLPY